MIRETIAESLTEFITRLIEPEKDTKNNIHDELDSIENRKLEIYRSLIEDYKKQPNKNAYKNTMPLLLQNSIDYFNVVWYLSENKGFNANRQHFYRGNSNKQHLLVPGVYRNKCKDERFLLREMQVRCASQLTQSTLLDKLVFLQHYGCPTRLLDITSNPLVALYFACLNDEDHDGVVSCFSVKEEDVLYPNSDRAQMLSHLSEFSSTEKDDIMVLAYLNTLNEKFKQNSTYYVESIIEKLFHAIQREIPAFQRAMRPYDLLRPAFIRPAKSNPRIIQQNGAFILSGLNVDEVDCDNKIRKYVAQRIYIPAQRKQAILRDLERIGICQATLFPEADKVADYLQKC